MDTAVPGAQARTSLQLPSSRQVPGASLPATFWKTSQKKFPPLGLGNASLPGDTFTPGGRRLPVFLTPLISLSVSTAVGVCGKVSRMSPHSIPSH